MAAAPDSPINSQPRSNWLRMRTLTNLRWLAIVGQAGAVILATSFLGLTINIGLAMLAIGASVLFNTVAMVRFPRNRRLSENQVMATLIFDMTQLVALLFLTGGLNNPFALLILAPVTISAATLRLRAILVLGSFAIVMITFVATVNLPLMTQAGVVLRMPSLFVIGFWVALVIGVVFLSSYARRIATESQVMSQALLATQMALSREQKLTDLGGVVAAAAHELGTPLATIKLVSTELVEELADNRELMDDAKLIRLQADRCRDILRDMGRSGNEDQHLRFAPISAVVDEAAEPHSQRGKTIEYSARANKFSESKQPTIARKPEIIHGVRNLIQNAVDFADNTVWVDVRWTDDIVKITVADDGPGYPPELIGLIGDPFLRKRARKNATPPRPGYSGMGLGLFIAKTLLERSGGTLKFSNGTDPFLNASERSLRGGAIADIIWQRATIERDESFAHAPLGRNQPLNS